MSLVILISNQNCYWQFVLWEFFGTLQWGSDFVSLNWNCQNDNDDNLSLIRLLLHKQGNMSTGQQSLYATRIKIKFLGLKQLQNVIRYFLFSRLTPNYVSFVRAWIHSRMHSKLTKICHEILFGCPIQLAWNQPAEGSLGWFWTSPIRVLTDILIRSQIGVATKSTFAP
jgi:hypothetical protein